MKFEDVKNSTWGLLERSDLFEDGFLIFLDGYDSEMMKLDNVYELSFTTANGSATGNFIFFGKMSDLHIFVKESDIDIEISYHDDNNKILTLVF